MNNKGIAINTILMLVVGILVVGVIIYLVFTFTSGPAFSVQECRTGMIQYCTLCANVGWPPETDAKHIEKPGELRQCGLDYDQFWYWSIILRDSCSELKGDCEALGVK